MKIDFRTTLDHYYHGLVRVTSFFLAVFAVQCVAFVACAVQVSAESSSRPNVVVILADDQGWGDLSLHDNPNLSTPNIDSLARDGAQIKHFYVCAVCSPTRAEFLTGRYHTRMGVYSTSAGGERFSSDEQTIGDVFRTAGYATAAYGKWHSGMQWPYHPNARGFADYFGFCSGHWGNYFSPMLEHNGAIVQGNGFIIDDLTDHAIDFMSANRDKPFFVYLPLNTPHSPMQVPDKYWDRHKNQKIVPDPAPENQKGQNIEHTRAAMAMCENIDDNVGRILKHLDQANLADDTIVIYFSDNGPNGKRFNGGMRGRKGSTFEGGLRSPCLIRYPRKIPAGHVVTDISAAIDLLPTLAEFADIKLQSPKPLDGKSIKRALAGEKSANADRLLFSVWNGETTVRSQRFRMQKDGSLFDLENDPGEKKNVANDHPKVATQLAAALAKWTSETNPLPRTHHKVRPFPLGHPDAKWTQMPSRDAKFTGNITRSNRFPNCTFLSNWKSTDDRITWDVDVLADGKFEVELYYSCPETNVGSQIELSCGTNKLNATLTVANDVPLIGMDEDRTKRIEGYVRKWKPMKLGSIELSQGRQTLQLKANKIVGDQVGDMRLLMFRRIK